MSLPANVWGASSPTAWRCAPWPAFTSWTINWSFTRTIALIARPAWLNARSKRRCRFGRGYKCCVDLRQALTFQLYTSESVRIGKWLWAVRLYKSRSLAAQACHAGHVKIGGNNVKPSRDVRPGEGITVFAGRALRTVKVLALLDQRVGAKIVSEILADLTPPAEYA